MNEEIRDLLEEEIKAQIESLGSLKSGSQEKSRAVTDLMQVYKLKIEEDKIELESNDKQRRMENEEVDHERDWKLKSNQLDEQVKDRYFRLASSAAQVILPLLFYGVWMKKGLKFEETGTFTSQTFRGLINCFRPGKK